MNIIMNITSVHLEAMLMYNEGNFTPLEKKSLRLMEQSRRRWSWVASYPDSSHFLAWGRSLGMRLVMGRRWPSVGEISAPEEPQYWMQNNVETCSMPIEEIGCVCK